MRSIRGIVFDLEGTIVSVEDCHTGGFSVAAASYGINFEPSELLLMPGYVGAGDPGVIKMFCEKYGRPDVDPEEFRQRKMVEYERLLGSKKLELRAGFEDFLSLVRSHRFGAFVISLTPTSQALPLIAGVNLESLIPREQVILLEDVKQTKPNPEALYLAAKRMGCRPDELIVFGDGMKDMQLAKNGGAIGIGIPCNTSSYKELMDAGAFTVFRSWEHINFTGLIESIQREGV